MSHQTAEEFRHELLYGTGAYPHLTTQDHLDVLPPGAAIFGAPRSVGDQGESFLRVDVDVEGDKHWHSSLRELRLSPSEIPLPATIFFLPRKFQDQAIGEQA